MLLLIVARIETGNDHTNQKDTPLDNLVMLAQLLLYASTYGT